MSKFNAAKRGGKRRERLLRLQKRAAEAGVVVRKAFLLAAARSEVDFRGGHIRLGIQLPGLGRGILAHRHMAEIRESLRQLHELHGEHHEKYEQQ